MSLVAAVTGVGLGLPELLLILLVTLPTLLVPAALLYLVFRAGRRHGAAEAPRRRREDQSFSTGA